jgi:hypothetical protein
MGIKPQDILVLLELVSHPKKEWRLGDLAARLGLSQSEVSAGMMRASYCGLMSAIKRSVNRASLAEFLIHGIRYTFPVKPGPLGRGIPTAHSAPPLARVMRSASGDSYVWPHPEGTLRGQTLAPLYPSAPSAAEKDPPLHEWLALVDALRAGQARERGLAGEEIKKRLGV